LSILEKAKPLSSTQVSLNDAGIRLWRPFEWN